MQSFHERVVQAVMGMAGLVAGVLSAVALAIVAMVGPVLGVCAVVSWPIRALVERLRRQNRAAPPIGG